MQMSTAKIHGIKPSQMTSGETRCQTLHHINHIDQSLHYYSGMVINFSIHNEKPSHKSISNIYEYMNIFNAIIILHKIHLLGTLKSFWCKYEHCLWRKCMSHDIHSNDSMFQTPCHHMHSRTK